MILDLINKDYLTTIAHPSLLALKSVLTEYTGKGYAGRWRFSKIFGDYPGITDPTGGNPSEGVKKIKLQKTRSRKLLIPKPSTSLFEELDEFFHSFSAITRVVFDTLSNQTMADPA